MSTASKGKKLNAWTYRWWDRYIDGIHGPRKRVGLPISESAPVWTDFYLGDPGTGISANAIIKLDDVVLNSFTKTQAVTTHAQINGWAMRWWDRYIDGIHSMRSRVQMPTGNTAQAFSAFYLGNIPAGGITANLSVTLDAVTLSATGTISSGITANLSVTLDNATLSSSSALAIAATLAKTLDAMTLSSAAQMKIAAALAPTLGDVALSSVVALKIQAALSILLGDTTLISDAHIPVAGITGNLSATLENAVIESLAVVSRAPFGGDGGTPLFFVRRVRGPHWQDIIKKFEKGELHSSSIDGPIVTNPKQARAIAYSVEEKKWKKEERLDDLAMGNPFNNQR